MIAARQIVPALLVGAAGRAGRHAGPRPRLVRLDLPAGHRAGLAPARRRQALRGRSDAVAAQVKYVLWLLILVAALLGNLTFLILDPITLLYRTATTALGRRWWR